MDRQQLRYLLAKEGVPEWAYSLSGGLAEDRLCLDEVHGRWLVYYVERGRRWNERWFRTEDEACRHMLDQLRAG